MITSLSVLYCVGLLLMISSFWTVFTVLDCVNDKFSLLNGMAIKKPVFKYYGDENVAKIMQVNNCIHRMKRRLQSSDKGRSDSKDNSDSRECSDSRNSSDSRQTQSGRRELSFCFKAH